MLGTLNYNERYITIWLPRKRIGNYKQLNVKALLDSG